MKRTILFLTLALITTLTASAQITSVGIIGTATPDGWDRDTNMVQDPDSADLWTMNITLLDGVVKFRTNDDWGTNWGNDNGDFPFGTGTQDEGDIPVVAGDYMITLNTTTGEYFFDYAGAIGILGDALPFGWDRDINMFTDSNGVFYVTLDLTAGAAKFRQDDAWDINWGNDAGDFPSGSANPGEGDIPIPAAGNYTIMLDTAALTYEFIENVTFGTVGIIGDATAGGWDAPTALNKDPDDGDVWSANVTLTDGGVQFSADSGAVIWGGAGFPDDTASVDGDTIPAMAGDYVVTINTETGIYSFSPIIIYGTMGIIGDATPGGWDVDTDMIRSETDSSMWTLQVELLAGEAKIRADDDWIDDWGGVGLSGIAEYKGPNFVIPETDDYLITFNSLTLEYEFRALVLYDTVGLIGLATEFGDWDNDVIMTRSDDDPNLWSLTEYTVKEDECKFRADRDWTVNWGDPAFPSGVGTQDGDNINALAGTYNISLNSITGEYAFVDPSTSTQEVLNPSSILAYPNPTSDALNIDMSELEVSGLMQLSVFDMSGRLMLSDKQMADQIMQIDVSNLAAGHYTLRLSNDDVIIGKRFVVAGR